MTTPLTVAVTGATGFVGSAVVRRLIAQGHNVRALVRDTAKARQSLPLDLPPERLSLVQGHVHDGQSPAKLLLGADACINLIGIIREQPGGAFGGQTFQRMHVDATRVLVDACVSGAGGKPVRRFVQMSAMSVRRDHRAPYAKTKFEGEQIVRRSGLDWTVFRPSTIHGKDGEFTKQIKGWCDGSVSPYWIVPYFTRTVEHDDGVVAGRVSFEPALIAPVLVDDVAAAFVACLDKPESFGEVYNICGSETLDWRQMLEWYSNQFDSGLPILGVPAEPHVWIARIAKTLGMGGLLPFDEGMAVMAQQDSMADLVKLKTHLGVNPAPFRASAKKYVKAMA